LVFGFDSSIAGFPSVDSLLTAPPVPAAVDRPVPAP